MNKMVEGVMEIFVGVVLLIALAAFIATANTTQLGVTATMVIGLIVTIMSIGLLYKGAKTFIE